MAACELTVSNTCYYVAVQKKPHVVIEKKLDDLKLSQ